MNKFEKYNRLRQEAAKIVEDINAEDIEQAWQAWFKDNPKYFAVAWKQGTPSFNDGEPCMFATQEFYFLTQEGILEAASKCGNVDVALLNKNEGEFLKSIGYNSAKSLYCLAESAKWADDVDGMPEIHDDILEIIYGDSYVVHTRNGSYTSHYNYY